MRRLTALVLLLAAPAALTADEFTDDVKRLIAAVGLRAGQTIADIGAGQGELTVALAQHVGPSGRVFATEIDPGSRDHIQRATADAGLQHVTVLEAGNARTNLPPACCDLIVVRFVYHHFSEPNAMGRSLFESVKRGGYVAIIDFPPRTGPTAAAERRAANESHGVDTDTVSRELTAAGFERISVTPGDDRAGYLIVMRRPE
jgi:ubiquinone/menaquinone biosynthesis C-methylase UbiE